MRFVGFALVLFLLKVSYRKPAASHEKRGQIKAGCSFAPKLQDLPPAVSLRLRTWLSSLLNWQPSSQPSAAQPNLPAAQCQKCWSFRELQVLSLFSKPETDPSCFFLAPRALQVVLNSMADVLSKKVLQPHHFFRLEVHIKNFLHRGT